MKVKRALISVSDKTGLIDFAKGLHELGIKIVSTGGTMKAIREAGIPVTYVSEVTGFPEIMDGRVKTLHPKIHGGILAVRDNPEHVSQMAEQGIEGFDLVVVNLYPFCQTIAKPDVTLEDAIENIDIGGPSMVRAAAKNYKFVAIVVRPNRYSQVLSELKAEGEVSDTMRMQLAQEAFQHTSEYDAYIASYLAKQNGEGEFTNSVHLMYEKVQDLRYGENPHQKAAFYRQKEFDGFGVAAAKQLHGKELSFNNIVDLEAAYNLVGEFLEPAAVIIKHTNPCGTAIGSSLKEAYVKAYQADSTSAFGGIIGLNQEVDVDTAKEISAIFVEAVIAPSFSSDALRMLAAKKNIRLLQAKFGKEGELADKIPDIKKVSGGLLLQDKDCFEVSQEAMKVVTTRQPSQTEWEQLMFAWKVVKHVKSNAIVVVKDNVTIGVGAGQMNRVGSAEIAFHQAGDKAKGAVLSSDAFFPFGDTVEAAAKAGITAIIQPGGSIRDEESIQAANQYHIAMVFTGERHFKH